MTPTHSTPAKLPILPFQPIRLEITVALASVSDVSVGRGPLVIDHSKEIFVTACNGCSVTPDIGFVTQITSRFTQDG